MGCAGSAGETPRTHGSQQLSAVPETPSQPRHSGPSRGGSGLSSSKGSSGFTPGDVDIKKGINKPGVNKTASRGSSGTRSADVDRNGSGLSLRVSPLQSNKSATVVPAEKPEEQAAAAGEANLEERAIMQNSYRIGVRKEDVMGEGTFSICYTGTDVKTNEKVAIKIYKTSTKTGQTPLEVLMTKFVRQITVLKELQEPFASKPSDPRLWCDRLADAKPSRLFMELLDYSKDSDGNPGPDPDDGILYVVTELAQYSLKDYLSLRREENRPLLPASVKNITKAVLLVVAGLHAKGLVHLDLKPENLMMFNGRLKLIDVDGCVKAGSMVTIEDSSISFSPCYCAPEWATFLIEDGPTCINPALDCWSLGMTLCELVTLDAVLKPIYANFLRNGRSHRDAAFLFMDWLSGVIQAPISKAVKTYDPQFLELLLGGLLICDPKKRKTCAEVLQMEFITSDEVKKPKGCDLASPDASPKLAMAREPSGSASVSGINSSKSKLVPEANETVQRRPRIRAEDTSSKAAFKGVLWKLNSDGKPQEPSHWLKRDMWITDNGALSYWSVKENKRLVLVGGDRLAGAKIGPIAGSAMPHALEVQTNDSQESEVQTSFFFAAESEKEYDDWLEKLRSASSLDAVMDGFRLGQEMAMEAKAFRKIKNRRQVVESDEKDDFAPVFKAKLWKLKAEGNRLREADWFEREMWLAKNGSLVYWSKRDERDLIYYTPDDIERADITRIPDKDSWRPFTFQVELSPLVGHAQVQFAAGDFAAETEEMRDKWITELLKCKQHSLALPGALQEASETLS